MTAVGDGVCNTDKGSGRDYAFVAICFFAVIGVLEIAKAVVGVSAAIFAWAATKQGYQLCPCGSELWLKPIGSEIWISPSGSKYHSSSSCKGLSGTTSTSKTACKLCWK